MLTAGSGGISCPSCFQGAHLGAFGRAPFPTGYGAVAGPLGLTDRTRDVLAVTGVCLAAAGLSFAIWSSSRRSRRRPVRRRKALLYHGRADQRYMTLP